MTYLEANNAVELIEKNIKELDLYDWDEIFDYVPNSDDVKEEVVKLIENISNVTKELKSFFK
jgi:hypothetical protein